MKNKQLIVKEKPSQLAFTSSKSTNLFKVKNKDTRTTSMTGKCRLGMHQLV